MWTAEHDKVACEFLLNPEVRLLLVSIDFGGDGTGGDTAVLRLSTEMPSKTVATSSPMVFEYQHFVLGSATTTLTPDNISKEVTFGVIAPEDLLDSLMRVMNTIYVPQVVGNSNLPESVHKSLTQGMHRFMANLTETAFQMHGKTVLYIPQESTDLSDLDAIMDDKDLVQRLESTVIRWTRQIKEVVNLQTTSKQDAETSTPLDEIEFWRERTVDLSGIRDQLALPEVKQIAGVLHAVKSSYLNSFQDLSAIIHEGSNEAQDNLKFLSTLKPLCEQLAEAAPAEVVEILPKLLSVIRMIWSISKHYNQPERMTKLLRNVSNAIMVRCCAGNPCRGHLWRWHRPRGRKRRRTPPGHCMRRSMEGRIPSYSKCHQ